MVRYRDGLFLPSEMEVMLAKGKEWLRVPNPWNARKNQYIIGARACPEDMAFPGDDQFFDAYGVPWPHSGLWVGPYLFILGPKTWMEAAIFTVWFARRAYRRTSDGMFNYVDLWRDHILIRTDSDG